MPVGRMSPLDTAISQLLSVLEALDSRADQPWCAGMAEGIRQVLDDPKFEPNLSALDVDDIVGGRM